MEDDAETRYQRLQLLLQKSTLYSKYILNRIEVRKEEQAKRLEQQKKRELKKQKEEEEAANADKNASVTPEKDLTRRVNLRAKADGPKRKLTLKAPVPKSQLSVSNSGDAKTTTPVEIETAPEKNETSKRGRKRKAPSDYTQLVARAVGQMGKPASKRAKKENEDPTMESEVENVLNLPKHPEMDSEGRVVKPVLLTGGDLRPYQIDGLNWLKTMYVNCVNGILADEMGLGKTIQCIATIAELIYNKCEGPYLIVAPLSTLPNWNSEFKKFTPDIPVIFYHGTKEERGDVRNKISKVHNLSETMKTRSVVLTSYEIAINDRPFLQHFKWKYLIVDEGHRLKNMDCKLVRELKMYNSINRLLLTGTPLQNNLSELWSLLNFLLPKLFDDLGSFESWFDVRSMETEESDVAIIAEEKKKNILGMFHQILSPFMLRRVKTDVDLKIPPKKEIMVLAHLTKVQKDYYESIVDKSIAAKLLEPEPEEPVELTSTGRPRRYASKKCTEMMSLMMEDGDEEEIQNWCKMIATKSTPRESVQKSRPSAVGNLSMRNIMMMLRRVCNHPYLIEYPLTETDHYKVDADIVKTCGKMEMLDRMLKELKQRGHKVLIFSQMTKMMDVLGDYMYYRRYNFCRLDGSTSVEDRRNSIESFNSDPDMFVFLLSTRAGGLGINLTSADTVIIYDSDWNPQNDLQAQDRCHRIGQTRPVMVYRLVTANTIDQKIVQRAAAKRKLEKMVIKKGHFKNGMAGLKTDVKPISAEELMELLNSSDHSRTVGEKENYVMSKKEMDALLDRSDMIEEFERTKQGLSGKPEEIDDAQLRTSSRGSFKLFETLDYDSGDYEQQRETTVEDQPANDEQREATPENQPASDEQRETTEDQPGTDEQH